MTMFTNSLREEQETLHRVIIPKKLYNAVRASFVEEKGKLYDVKEMTHEDFNELKSLCTDI